MSKDNKKYLVLARKYRPQTFTDLIGQEVLVKTLTNAINTGKLAQSYILTGIRGIGKTSSARIIAKALNCIGVDGKGKETPNPCGVCEHCRAITEDRHVDVQEIDAASNTGVDNAREIIEAVRYNPVSARYKIYIIDEVHMLSKAAFNALLKTLEEPPPKVKFIFATTEVRKVPVTVLSRCQRFDLRRIGEEELVRHFTGISKKESVSAEEEAVRIIARYADGSVRDGLSLLDQAIAQSEGKITADGVREMVGVSSKENILQVYEALLKGNAAEVLALVQGFYKQGYEPVSVIQDLLDMTHLLTKIKLNAADGDDLSYTLQEKEKILGIASGVGLPVLALFWQMLLKGIDEMRYAPSSLQALEMVMVRMCYMQSNVPTLESVDALKKEISTSSTGASVSSLSVAISTMEEGQKKKRSKPTLESEEKQLETPTDAAEYQIKKKALSSPAFSSLADIVTYANSQGEFLMALNIKSGMRVVKFSQGLIDFKPGKGMPEDLPYKLMKKLLEWTGERWFVSDVKEGEAEPTLQEQEAQTEADFKKQVVESDLVKKVLDSFKGAKVVEVSRVEEEFNEEPTEEEEI